MQNKSIYIILGIIVIIGAIVLLGSNATEQNENIVQSQNDARTQSEQGPVADDDVAEGEGDTANAVPAGTYETYSEEKLVLAEKGDLVLFFKASWCPTCRALDANIKANLEEIPENVSILEVDYDTATELKQKYGITVQHTLVQVDQDGEMISKWTGSPTLARLVAEIK